MGSDGRPAMHAAGKNIKCSKYFIRVGKGFPGGAVVESPPANAGDTGSIPGPGSSHMWWSY